MTRRATLLGLLLLLALPAGLEAAPLKLGRRYRDESNGFQIYPPAKWEQVPTKFQDVATIGKWVGRAKRGYYAPELHVLRFLKAREVTGEGPEQGRPVPAGYGAMLRFQPKNVWEEVDRLIQRLPGGAAVVADEPDFRMSSKRFKAHLKVFRQNAPEGAKQRDADKRRLLLVAAEIDTVAESDSTYGVVFYATVADERDMLRTFERIVSRFKILDPDEEDEEEAGIDADLFVDSSKKPEAWREARRKKLIPGWDAVDTEHYLIVYNKEVKRALIRKIAKHIEAIRAQVYEKLFPPVREVKAISVVRVCKDAAEYHRYGGPGGSAGYWSPSDEELVFYEDKSNKKDSLRVLYHEAFHQYIHYAVGDVAPHSWFNEGHGDYFSGHNYVGGKFVPKPFRWRTGIIANAIAQKTYVPLKKFLKYTQAEYYANPGLCYAQGWSLIYFLREVERRKIRKYKKYWGVLDRYFEAIKRNVKAVKEGGLEGLNERPQPAGPEVEGRGEEEGGDDLPRLPGLEQPFPGEHPLAGAAGEDGAGGKLPGRTVAGPRITGIQSALDAAVDEAFKGIDIDQLEKDWIEFMK